MKAFIYDQTSNFNKDGFIKIGYINSEMKVLTVKILTNMGGKEFMNFFNVQNIQVQMLIASRLIEKIGFIPERFFIMGDLTDISEKSDIPHDLYIDKQKLNKLKSSF